MKCPNCGNEDPRYFRSTAASYASAFNAGNEAVHCGYCRKDFYPTPIIEPIETGTSANAYQSKKYPTSTQLPPLNPAKASKEMLNQFKPTSNTQTKLDIGINNNSFDDFKVKQFDAAKQAEVESWIAKKRPETLNKKISNISDTPSIYNKRGQAEMKALEEKSKEAKTWAAEMNRMEKEKRAAENIFTKAMPNTNPMLAKMATQNPFKELDDDVLNNKLFGPKLTEEDVRRNMKARSAENVKKLKKQYEEEGLFL